MGFAHPPRHASKQGPTAQRQLKIDQGLTRTTGRAERPVVGSPLVQGGALGNHEISHDLTQPLALDQLALLRLEVISNLRMGAGRHLNLAGY